LRHIGLPAILTLVAGNGERQFAVLRHLTEDTARLLIDGQAYDVDASTLDTHWRGQFVVLWRMPENYYGPIQPGTIGPVARWLVTKLNQIEGIEDQEPVRAIYSAELEERVKRLQRHVGEEPDGIVGVNTLIQLFRLTEAGMPRLDEVGETL
jgi:general secretion pathway protein A